MSYTYLNSSDHKSRKERICDWCGEPILIGEMYHKTAGIFEGDFQHNAFHPECVAACHEHCRKNDGEFDPRSSENIRPSKP